MNRNEITPGIEAYRPKPTRTTPYHEPETWAELFSSTGPLTPKEHAMKTRKPSTWGATFDAPDATPPATPTNTSFPERRELERQIDAAKQRAEDAESDLQVANDQHSSEIEESRKAIVAANTENERLEKELEEALAEVEDARADHAELIAGREKIIDLENAAAIEANRLSAAWKEIETLRASLAAGRDKAPALAPVAPRDVDAARTIRALQNDLDAAYERIVGLKASNAELRAWADRATTAAPSPPAERDTTPPAPRQPRKPAPELAASVAHVTPAPRSTRQRFDVKTGKWQPV